MAMLEPYGLYRVYPEKIPDYDADVFAASGAARLFQPTPSGDATIYSFPDQRFLVVNDVASLHRRASSDALQRRPSNVLSLTSPDPLMRVSTPQPSSSMSRQLPTISPTDDMMKQVTIFEKDVQQYNSALDKNAARIEFQHCRNIEDLKFELERLAEYHQSAKTSSNRHLRLWLRKSANFAPAVNSWLALLPGDCKELSVLVGGLHIVFAATMRLGEVREETYEMLDEIPESLSRASRICTTYQNRPKLRTFVSRLYIAVLEALSEIMKWYAVSSVKKFVKSVLSGPKYGEAISACKQKLLKIEDSIRKEAEVDLHSSVGSIGYQLEALPAQLEREANQRNLELLRESERRYLFLQQEVLANERALIAFRAEKKKKDNSLRRTQHLLRSVRFEPEQLLGDQDQILNSSLAMNQETQGYSGAIIQSPEMASWLNSASSGVLAINANETYTTTSTVSLTSFILIRMLRERSSTVILFWFCSLHTEDDDLRQMVLSMIGQLCDSAACAIDFNECWNVLLEERSLFAADLRTLLWILDTLIQEQLTHTPINIIVDSVSFYEGFTFYDQTAAFFSLMRSLVDLDRYSLHSIKLLITSPQTVSAETEELLQANVLNSGPKMLWEALSYIRPVDEYIFAGSTSLM